MHNQQNAKLTFSLYHPHTHTHTHNLFLTHIQRHEGREKHKKQNAKDLSLSFSHYLSFSLSHTHTRTHNLVLTRIQRYEEREKHKEQNAKVARQQFNEQLEQFLGILPPKPRLSLHEQMVRSSLMYSNVSVFVCIVYVCMYACMYPHDKLLGIQRVSNPSTGNQRISTPDGLYVVIHQKIR